MQKRPEFGGARHVGRQLDDDGIERLDDGGWSRHGRLRGGRSDAATTERVNREHPRLPRDDRLRNIEPWGHWISLDGAAPDDPTGGGQVATRQNEKGGKP